MWSKMNNSKDKEELNKFLKEKNKMNTYGQEDDEDYDIRKYDYLYEPNRPNRPNQLTTSTKKQSVNDLTSIIRRKK